jgi:uncharacterized membrane protein YeaQ/YmgE (transglycosylase-associated protein family)
MEILHFQIPLSEYLARCPRDSEGELESGLELIPASEQPGATCFQDWHALFSVIENHSIEAQSKRPTRRRELVMSILWTIIIGFVAGLIAKFLHPGNKNEPSGFILTTLLGIAGAFVATFLGQAVGWYKAGEGAGFIGAIVGAIIVLVVWGIFANRRAQGV